MFSFVNGGAGAAVAPEYGLVPLTALHTEHLGSPTAARASGQRTPGSGAKTRQLVYFGQLYGHEAVGRHCSVLYTRDGQRTFERAQVVEFNPGTGQHKIRHGNKADEWVSLADIKFKWNQVLPADAVPNPTYKAEYSGEAAVGKRLRVYWPAMQKWYCGTVRAYDPVHDLHTITYKDGDVQTLMLKHEPIIWAEDELAAEGSGMIAFVVGNTNANNTNTMAAAAAAAAATPRSINSNAAAAAAAAGAAAPSAAAAITTPAAVTAAATVAAAAAAGGSTGALYNGALGHFPPSALQLPTTSGQAPTTSLQTPGSTRLAEAGGVLGSCFPATPKGSRRAPGKGGRPSTGRGSTALGKHGRDGSSAEGASKRRRGAAAQKLRQAALAAAAATAIADKHLAVGCRVGVYWRLDKAFYTGKLKSYSPQTGKFTVQYDDGQSESLLLERERFVWHAPRGVSAGYRPPLHVLMQQLGAEGLKALPQEGPDGKPVPVTPHPENAPHPPSTGPGAIGWRLQLYWPADGAWHEAEVLSYNEDRRKHHVLYLDGEEEWLDLAKEQVAWLKATRHGAISAGRFMNFEDAPKGRDALGWHVAVYWKDDKQFYQGQVADLDNAGRHKVLYVDGEEEWLHLRNERVIWRLPPSEASESGEDDAITDDMVDSDDSDDMMETEEATEDQTDDDGVGSSRKRAGITRYKRRRRTRKSRGSHLGFESDSSDPGRLPRQAQQSAWAAAGSSVGLGSLAAGAASSGVGLRLGHRLPSSCQAEQPATAAVSQQIGVDGATAGGATHPQFSVPRPQVGAFAGNDTAAGRAALGRQASTAAAGQQVQQQQGLGNGMRAPSTGLQGAAAGGMATAGTGIQRVSSAGLGLAGSGRLGSGVLGTVGTNGVLSLNLPAIQVRRAAGSGETGGSPLLRPGQSLDQLQLVVRIIPGGTAAEQRSTQQTGSSSNGVAAQPMLQHLPQGQQQMAMRLQRKMKCLDMILSKLTSTANMYGWQLEPQDPLPPLAMPQHGAAHGSDDQHRLQRTAGAAGGKGVAAGLTRQHSQPTSPTSGGANGRLGMRSPRAGSGPLSPRARASAAGVISGNGGSLPSTPRSAGGPISPTAAAAAAAGAAPAAAGRPVAVHKTCAVKSKPGSSSGGSGAQRLKAWPFGMPGAAAVQPSSSSTGPTAGGIAAGTAGGSGELTSSLLATAAGAAASGSRTQQQQQQQQQAAPVGGEVAVGLQLGGPAAAEVVARHLQQQQQQQALLAATLAAAAASGAPASNPAAAAAAAAAASKQMPAASAALAGPSPAAAAAAAAVAAVLPRLAAGPGGLPDVSHPAAPSVALTADEVLMRLQAMAAVNLGSQGTTALQQLQSLQSAATASAGGAQAAQAGAGAGAGKPPAEGTGDASASKAPGSEGAAPQEKKSTAAPQEKEDS